MEKIDATSLCGSRCPECGMKLHEAGHAVKYDGYHSHYSEYYFECPCGAKYKTNIMGCYTEPWIRKHLVAECPAQKYRKCIGCGSSEIFAFRVVSRGCTECGLDYLVRDWDGSSD